MSNITFTAAIAGSAPSRAARESFWRETLAGFAASGQSVAVFCQARGLNPRTCYAWRLKLDRRDRQDSPAPALPQSAPPAFVPVRVEPRAAQAQQPFEVELRGGRVLRLSGSMPAARLAEVLHALEGQP